jgi:hypothetical protein
MKFDLLTPSQLPYPGQQLQGCGNQQYGLTIGGGSYQSPARDGLLNSIFTPDDLPYPLPIVVGNPGAAGQSTSNSNTQCNCGSPYGSGSSVGTCGNTSPPGGAPANSGQSAPASSSPSTPQSGAPSSGAAAASSTQPAPGQIIINVGVPTTQQPATSTPASSSSAPASTAPVSSSPASAPAQSTPAPYARAEQFTSVEWLVHATRCAQPNPRLPQVLQRMGFTIEELPVRGLVYRRVDAIGG